MSFLTHRIVEALEEYDAEHLLGKEGAAWMRLHP